MTGFDEMMAIAMEVAPDKADAFIAELRARLGGHSFYIPQRKRQTPLATPDHRKDSHRLTASDARRRAAPPRTPRLLR